MVRCAGQTCAREISSREGTNEMSARKPNLVAKSWWKVAKGVVRQTCHSNKRGLVDILVGIYTYIRARQETVHQGDATLSLMQRPFPIIDGKVFQESQP